MADKLTEEQWHTEIKKLHNEKVVLLQKHGVFGGGEYVNTLHRRINAKLEALGVMENHTLSYQDYLKM